MATTCFYLNDVGEHVILRFAKQIEESMFNWHNTYMKDPAYVYIMSCKSRSVLYVGVTSNLDKRVKQHKNHVFPNSFTNRYNCIDLVYYEEFASIEEAILREKKIKGWTRDKKDSLIKELNPNNVDLASDAD